MKERHIHLTTALHTKCFIQCKKAVYDHTHIKLKKMNKEYPAKIQRSWVKRRNILFQIKSLFCLYLDHLDSAIGQGAWLHKRTSISYLMNYTHIINMIVAIIFTSNNCTGNSYELRLKSRLTTLVNLRKTAQILYSKIIVYSS